MVVEPIVEPPEVRAEVVIAVEDPDPDSVEDPPAPP